MARQKSPSHASGLFAEPEGLKPLAERMRPRTLDEIVGQQRLVGEGTALRRSIEAGHVHSMILWGPPGCGKTTLALLLAKYADAEFRAISAVLSGLPDVRAALAEAEARFAQGRRSATEHARVLNLSSVMGSLTGARDLHSPSYRISKAALNMAGVMMARALNPRGVGVLTVHPGWVRTDMGGASAPLAPAAAVRALLDLVERCPGLPAGEFRDPEGQLIPW